MSNKPKTLCLFISLLRGSVLPQGGIATLARCWKQLVQVTTRMNIQTIACAKRGANDWAMPRIFGGTTGLLSKTLMTTDYGRGSWESV